MLMGAGTFWVLSSYFYSCDLTQIWTWILNSWWIVPENKMPLGVSVKRCWVLLARRLGIRNGTTEACKVDLGRHVPHSLGGTQGAAQPQGTMTSGYVLKVGLRQPPRMFCVRKVQENIMSFVHPRAIWKWINVLKGLPRYPVAPLRWGRIQ